MSVRSPSIPQIDSLFAWRLVVANAISLSAVGPTKRAPCCNASSSPLSLHALASIVAAGSSVSPANPTAASAALRLRLLHQLSSHGFTRRLPSKSATSAIAAAVIVEPTEENKPAAGSARAYLDSALWVKEYLFIGHNNLTWEAGRYSSLFHSAEFQEKPDEVAREVNEWLKEAQVMLKNPEDMISPGSVHADTEIIMANVLWFYGLWDPDLGLVPAGCSDFYRAAEFKFPVPFMTGKKPQQIASFPGFKSLRLPFAHGEDEKRYAMYIFLPDERNKMFNLLFKFAKKPWFLESYLPKEMVPVGEFMVPVREGFSINSSAVMIWPPCPYPASTENKEQTGEEKEAEERDDPSDVPFLPRSYAISRFIDAQEKREGEAIERGENEDEKGEADVIADVKAVDFVADHPFLYAIREDTSKTILVVGYVNNPICGDPYYRVRCSGGGDPHSEDGEESEVKAVVEGAEGANDAGGVEGAKGANDAGGVQGVGGD